MRTYHRHRSRVSETLSDENNASDAEEYPRDVESQRGERTVAKRREVYRIRERAPNNNAIRISRWYIGRRLSVVIYGISLIQSSKLRLHPRLSSHEIMRIVQR